MGGHVRPYESGPALKDDSVFLRYPFSLISVGDSSDEGENGQLDFCDVFYKWHDMPLLERVVLCENWKR